MSDTAEREWVIEEMNRLERQLQEQIAELRDELLVSERRCNKYAEMVLEAYAKVRAAYPDGIPLPQSLRA